MIKIEIKFNSDNKKRTPTSKKLTWGVFLVWAISVAASYILSYFGCDTSFLITATTASVGIVLTGYFSKSYFENKEQYGNAVVKKKDDTNCDSELGC